MTTRRVRSAIVVTALAFAALFGVVVWNSAQWVGAVFPGFFVMANRVVPSISLTGWPDASALFQREVIAVGDVPVPTSADVYEHVRRQPPGRRIAYTLRAPDGGTTTVFVPSQRFGHADYALLFGAYLLNGIAFTVIGLVVLWIKPRNAASYGLVATSLSVGLFIVTAVDLYGPHWFFRLHALAEAVCPVACLHLALVFPTDRLRSRRRLVLTCLYVSSLAFGMVYQLLLYQPAAYSAVHLVASSAVSVGGASILVAILYDLFTARSVLVRRRIGVVSLGALAGFVPSAVLMAVSGVAGGKIALNAGALTAFLFPLCLGYALVKEDLFEIDIMLRRTVSYAVVLVAVAGLYFSVLLILGLLVPGRHYLVRSPATLALINLGLLFLLAPIRDRVQTGIDRIFYQQRYNIEHAVSTMSHGLAVIRTTDQLIAHVTGVFAATIGPSQQAVLLPHGDSAVSAYDPAGQQSDSVALPPEIRERLDRGEILARYAWENGTEDPQPPLWSQLGADLLVPIVIGGTAGALVALGPKASGRSYSAQDIRFLRTASDQIALALSNVVAFDQLDRLNQHLEQLNQTLERQVRERTAALHATNEELNQSLQKLKDAYQQLERTHDSLLRADRLATLGRLTAGIAHEMNTPLGAVLNTLKIILDLCQEYDDSIDDPEVTADDHREIAAEIMHNATAAAEWTRKAAAFIRSVKAHGRDNRSAVEQFRISEVVDDAKGLVAHRLRAASCRVEFAETPEGLTAVGDAGRLNQVLVNLLTNAIEAYEERGIDNGRIEIRAGRNGGTISLAVRDWAGGIAPSVAPHIFEELYSTKGPRGTGLGLWIARNIVEEAFRGSLDLSTVPGGTTCFTAQFPHDAGGTSHADSTAPAAAVGSAADA